MTQNPLEPVMRFWRAVDRTFERVEDAWWGAVITESRFPNIWDVNYARIEARSAGLTLGEIEAVLLPSLGRSGATSEHLVIFHPNDQTELLSQLGQRGDKISWDGVMTLAKSRLTRVFRDPPEGVREIDHPTDGFWSRLRQSMHAFDIEDPAALEQLLLMERSLLFPGGKRWFSIRDDGVDVALASLMVLEGVGYIDHVMTFPEARRRGFATALTRHTIAEAAGAGVEDLFLFVDPGGPIRLYERLGFRKVADLASSLRPLI